MSHFQWQLKATPTNNRLKVAPRKQQLCMLIASDNGFTVFEQCIKVNDPPL